MNGFEEYFAKRNWSKGEEGQTQNVLYHIWDIQRFSKVIKIPNSNKKQELAFHRKFMSARNSKIKMNGNTRTMMVGSG